MPSLRKRDDRNETQLSNTTPHILYFSLLLSLTFSYIHTHTHTYAELYSPNDSPATLPYQVWVKSGSLRAPPISLMRRESVSHSTAAACCLLPLHTATAQYVPDGRHSWRQWASFTNISICVKGRKIFKRLARNYLMMKQCCPRRWTVSFAAEIFFKNSNQ